MAISLFEIFSIGIGPSSSHTLGPMRAALAFIEKLKDDKKFDAVASVQVDLYGSLGLTGKAHGSGKAVTLGLAGYDAETVDPDHVESILEAIESSESLNLNQECSIQFSQKNSIVYHRKETLPLHPNGMKFSALDSSSSTIDEQIYYSVGGGFIVEEGHVKKDSLVHEQERAKVPFAFKTGQDLLNLGQQHGKTIAQMVLANELAMHSEEVLRDYVGRLWKAMQGCVQRGLKIEGILPGGLKVQRRAPELYKKLSSSPQRAHRDPLTVMDWVNLYAIAVNEENAAGGRVVTAPTNGAAGILPAVLHYYTDLHPQADDDKILEFFLTASAIAFLFKENASISGAEVGCQGEVGVACSMAAAGLAAVLGGSNEQIENAAEIAMEHNLGLTCDPVGGLVQIPCIERNAMGAVKAINAARMALQGDGTHKISLDKVIKTMHETGADMQSKYKETSRGGLAANYIEC